MAVVKRSIYQHWDPLRTCIVGCSYGPEFYSYIQNPRVRTVMERIAIETEEDYQKLIGVLTKLGVEVWRPEMYQFRELYWRGDAGHYKKPPMVPRDWGGMFGDVFWWDQYQLIGYAKILEEIARTNTVRFYDCERFGMNTATTTRVGRDLYVGTRTNEEYQKRLAWLRRNSEEMPEIRRDEWRQAMHQEFAETTQLLPGYRHHLIETEGHSDGMYCPVKPGLIISLQDVQEYEHTFPGWEVVYLPNQGWNLVHPFLDLKGKNGGKWWVPGEEFNDDFTEYVEQWLNHWVGYVEESVFDVNMLVVDQQNVICNNYNQQVFDAFSRHGITAHTVNFRHRYFWDGGLHCITQDVHRDGVMQDWFPDRG